MAQGRTRDEVARLAGGVRGFLAWLFLTGQEPEDRSGWLDSPRMYRNERLPRHLSDEQLTRALSRVDRSTLYGRRDWAVLCLLNSYGLRIGEVPGCGLQTSTGQPAACGWPALRRGSRRSFLSRRWWRRRFESIWPCVLR